MASPPPSPPLPTEMSKKKRREDKAPSDGDEAGPSTAAAALPPWRKHPKRLWVKEQSRAWWDKCSHPDFPENEFRRAFRMGRMTFDMICEEIGSLVEKEDTTMRAAISVQQRIAVCIWRLATGKSIRKVSKQFGVGIATCANLFVPVCSAITRILLPKFVQWPADAASAAEIKSRFESLSSIPNIIGSMYTTHIPLSTSKFRHPAYVNRRHTCRNYKISYSVTMQGVVDPDGLFIDMCFGWPGSMSDEKVFEESMLCIRASTGELNNSWVVGGSSYPLMDSVLVPYTHENLTLTQHTFNEKIGEVQRVAREAFARLKKRWRYLEKCKEVNLPDLRVVLGACCVLHNICEMNKEEMDPELQYELFDDEMVAENGLRSTSMIQARDNIANTLLHHGLVGTTFF